MRTAAIDTSQPAEVANQILLRQRQPCAPRPALKIAEHFLSKSLTLQACSGALVPHT